MREPGEDDITIEAVHQRRDEREGLHKFSEYLETLSVDQIKQEIQEISYDLNFGRSHGATNAFIRQLADDLSLATSRLQIKEARIRLAGTLPQGKFWPELISAKDLLSLPTDPTRWIWDQTLPAGGASVLVAKPKIGKTTLAVGLALAVSRGSEFLGRKTIQAPVAYLSLDASLPEIAENFTTAGLKPDDQVYIHAGATPEKALDWLLEAIKAHSIRLVIIDTLQRFARFKDANDYSQVVNMMEPLLDASREANIHLLFTHHAKKDSSDDLDSAIGSTAIRGMAYTYLHMKKLPDSESRILRSDQRGGKNIEEIAVGFGDSGRIESRGTRKEVEVKEAEPKILELFEESGELTEKEIRQALPLRGWITGAALRQLHKHGDIERQGAGKSGHPYRYSKAPRLDSPLSLSPLLREEKRDIFTGLDLSNHLKILTGLNDCLVPRFRDETGTRRDETFIDPWKRVEVDILAAFPGASIISASAASGAPS